MPKAKKASETKKKVATAKGAKAAKKLETPKSKGNKTVTGNALISEHMKQVRKDFGLPRNAWIAENSKLKSYGNEEIIELPPVLDGKAVPYIRLAVYDTELVVEHRLKVIPESGNIHDLILMTRTY